MESRDRESTQDWLVPEEPDEEISVVREVPPVSEPDEAPASVLERFELAEARLRRAEELLRLDQDASHAAIEAAAAAERSAACAERAGAAALAAQETIADLTARTEVALSGLEAREMAAARRHAEARRESDALGAFRARADRIAAALRDLEASATAVSSHRADVHHLNGKAA